MSPYEFLSFKKRSFVVFFVVIDDDDDDDDDNRGDIIDDSSCDPRLLRSWVRIPPGARIFVCCECSVLSGIGLCDGLITRPEESCRLWCVVVCDQETS